MKRITTMLIGVIAFIIACNPDTLSPKAYIDWVEKSGHILKKEQQISGYTFSAYYQPATYLVLRENPDKKITELKQEIQDRSQFHYLNFRITPPPSQAILDKQKLGEEALQKRLAYLDFGLQKHLYLLSGDQRLDCVLAHFERSGQLTNHITLTLAFEKATSPEADFTLIYQDSILGLGNIQFPYSGSDIASIPHIN